MDGLGSTGGFKMQIQDRGGASLEALEGAVANVAEPAARDHIAALGVDYPGGYFNSGILLLDRDRGSVLLIFPSPAERLIENNHIRRDVLLARIGGCFSL